MSGAQGLRLLLTTDTVGGVWQYSLTLAEALAGEGAETVLVTLGPRPSTAQSRAAAEIEGLTLMETDLPLDWLSEGPDPVLAAAGSIAELAGDLCANIVQFHAPAFAAGALPPCPVIAVAHGCVSTWWEAARPGQPLDPAFVWHKELVAKALRTADRVVAPTQSYASAVARVYALRSVPGAVHNGRKASVMHFPNAPCDHALTAGRLWDPVKRTALLDRVAAGLAAPFFAAGALRAPHGEEARVDHLHWLGELEESSLEAELACRPVFVSAASFEPFGLAVLEAASAGCALVLSDIPSFRELWEGAAIFIDGGDEAPWIKTIDALLANGRTRQHLGETARRRASNYTPEAMGKAMLGIYADVLRERREAA